MTRLTMLLLLGTLASSAFAGILDVRHRTTLEDAAGDVESYDGGPVLDLTALTIVSDGSELAFSLTLATEASKVLAATNSAGAVVTVFFDLDDDPATGVTTIFGDKPGFEAELAIKACIEYDGGEACGGGLGGLPQTSHFAAWSVRKVKEGELANAHDVFWESPRGEIEGRTLSVTVPYAELGLEPGQRVRMAVQEAGGGLGAEAFLPEVRLTLK
ncbi:MAG TPA: hypothetical protein VLA66_03475 [Thermoanaerobaculia bacterium]|nr:hypothetical protein [Thermoanaerobaculia bacterium]